MAATMPTPMRIDATPRAMLIAAVGVFLAPGVVCERATTPAAIAATPKAIPRTSQLVTSASAPRMNEANGLSRSSRFPLATKMAGLGWCVAAALFAANS